MRVNFGVHYAEGSSCDLKPSNVIFYVIIENAIQVRIIVSAKFKRVPGLSNPFLNSHGGSTPFSRSFQSTIPMMSYDCNLINDWGRMRG